MAYNWKNGTPQVAFITGGGSGLGRQFAKQLVTQGTSVALFDLKIDDSLLNELEDLAPVDCAVLGLAVDMTDAEAVEAAVDEATRTLGAPDLAINSAGIAINATFDMLSQQAFEKVVAVNLFGSRNFAASVLPRMQAGAHLALVASLAGKVGSYGYAAYCASKFGVVGLAESLRQEQLLRNVDVSVLCPGEIATPLVEHEAKTIDAIARGIKDTGGTLEVDVACDLMMRQMAHGRFLVIPGIQSKLTNFVATRIPNLLRVFVNGKLRKLARESGYQPPKTVA